MSMSQCDQMDNINNSEEVYLKTNKMIKIPSLFYQQDLTMKISALFLSFALAISPAAFAQTAAGSSSSAGGAGAGGGAAGAGAGAAAAGAAAGVTVGAVAGVVAAVAVVAAATAKKDDPVYTITGTGTNTSRVCIRNC